MAQRKRMTSSILPIEKAPYLKNLFRSMKYLQVFTLSSLTLMVKLLQNSDYCYCMIWLGSNRAWKFQPPTTSLCFLSYSFEVFPCFLFPRKWAFLTFLLLLFSTHSFWLLCFFWTVLSTSKKFGLSVWLVVRTSWHVPFSILSSLSLSLDIKSSWIHSRCV